MEHEVVGKIKARVAAFRHGNPCKGLKIIAVAGAYGKTTVALLLNEILQEAGHSVVTLTNDNNTEAYDSSASAFQQAAARAKKKNVYYLVVEVTDALVETQVLSTIPIEMAVVTSDSSSAQALLRQPTGSSVVPSGFDVAGVSVAPHQAISFGMDDSAEAYITRVTERRKGTEVEMVIDHQIKIDVATYLIGQANALNVAAAVSAAYVLAVATDTFAEGIARLECVAGSYDYVEVPEALYDVVADRAWHTDSLKLVLESAKKLKKRRLLVMLDESVDGANYPFTKDLADRTVVVGSNPELTGVEAADSLKAALDLATRGAKKDDLLLLIGRTVAGVTDDGSVRASQLLQEESK